MPRQAGTNHELLRMALIGYEAEIGRINAAIAEIRARLGKASGDGASPERSSCGKIRTSLCRYDVNLSVRVNRGLVTLAECISALPPLP